MIGQTISYYKVIEKIDQGGMSEVYRAEDTNLSREVATKVLPEQFTNPGDRSSGFWLVRSNHFETSFCFTKGGDMS